jgi:hypothetical protein
LRTSIKAIMTNTDNKTLNVAKTVVEKAKSVVKDSLPALASPSRPSTPSQGTSSKAKPAKTYLLIDYYKSKFGADARIPKIIRFE